MINQNTVDSLVAAAKECSSPSIDMKEYLLTLLVSSIDTLGYDPEELAFREGVDKAASLLFEPKDVALLVIDLQSIMLLPELCANHSMRFAIATQTIGVDVPEDTYRDLDAVLHAGLLGVSDCYLGLVDSPVSLKEVAGSAKICQIRRTSGIGALSPRFDYMREKDPIWAALPDFENSVKGVIVWDSVIANESGYVGDVLMPYEESLPVFKRLSSVLELPDTVGAWFFDWRPAETETTRMVDCSNMSAPKLFSCSSQMELLGAGTTTEVTNYEVALNRNYCPAYYASGDYLHARNVPLGALAEKIQRGTTLSGKDLDVLGTIYKKDRTKDKSPSSFAILAGLGGPAPLGLRSSSCIIYGDDLWYIDNACIQHDGTVIPKVISEIPAGQRRYTLYPEDGICILIPRNGKAVVPFEAKVPTLISNNLFFVRIGTDKQEAEYIDCLVRSTLFKSQVYAASKPLSKEDVGAFVLPILSKKEQAKVVERDKSIRHKIIDLQNEIALLEMRDSFDPVEACGIEGRRAERMKEIENGAGNE